MPNRIIRESMNDSEPVNHLSLRAEVFYRRLQLLVDDFGRYEAKPAVLRGKLFYLQLDRWSLGDVTDALRECATTCRDDGTPLVRLYQGGARVYLEVTEFRQQVRATKSKYPIPDHTCASDAARLLCKCTASAHLDVSVSGDVSVSEDAGDVAREEDQPSGSRTPERAPPPPPVLVLPSEQERESIKNLIHGLAADRDSAGVPVGSEPSAVAAAEKRLAGSPDLVHQCEEIRSNHAAFLPAWAALIARGSGDFVPYLSVWFRDGDCLRRPRAPTASAEAPSQFRSTADYLRWKAEMLNAG